MFKDCTSHKVTILLTLPLMLLISIPAFARNNGNGRNLNELRQMLVGSPVSFSLSQNTQGNAYALAKTSNGQFIVVVTSDGSFQDQKPGEDEWKAKLLDAQNRRSSGITWFIVGLAGGTVLEVVGVATGSAPLAVLGAVGGSVAIVYGIVVWVSANDDIDNLKTEGKMKGYMTMSPNHFGPRLSLAVPF